MGDAVVKVCSFPFVGTPTPHASLNLSKGESRVAVGRDVLDVMTFDPTSRQSQFTTYRLHDLSIIDRRRLPPRLRMREILLVREDAVCGMNDASSTQSGIWRFSPGRASLIDIFGNGNPLTNPRITRIAARNGRILFLMEDRKCCMIAVSERFDELTAMLFTRDHVADFPHEDQGMMMGLMIANSSPPMNVRCNTHQYTRVDLRPC